MDRTQKTATLCSLYAQIWLYQFIGIAIFAVARITMLIMHASWQSLTEQTESIPLFLWNALRFDMQAITYISLPAILVALFAPFTKKNSIDACTRFMHRYYTVMLTLLAGLVTAEFFFHKNFNSRYNVVFFDFFDEGPIGLLQTMWQEYPVVPLLLFIATVSFAIYRIGILISRCRIMLHRDMRMWTLIASYILVAGLTFIFMRGSVTRYTLQVEAFVVSTDEAINQSVPNAVYMLKKAWKERTNSFKLRSDESILSKGGFSTIDEAILQAGLPLHQGNAEEKIEQALFGEVKEPRIYEGQTPPNVLLLLSESWSTLLLDMDKADSLDLLCSLRPHLQQDILLKNFQSVRNGTIYSLETVTMAMPYIRFFNSRYRFAGYPSSIAHPFKQNGYSTAFVTGMDPTWENVNEGLMHQMFDTVIGRREIMHATPGSTTSAIGVYDEFLMQYLFNRMMRNNTDRQPQFVMALTTTNHPPFTYPDNMQLPPLTDEWYNSQCLNGNKDVLQKYGLGAQYANQSIGDFLTKFKESPLAENTIVLITGDHNVRNIPDYTVVPQEYRYSVPLYIYLPPEYAIDKAQADSVAQRHGCHLDLLPTIAPLAFKKGTRYLNTGQNLLDTAKCNRRYYSYNEKQMLAPDGINRDSLMQMMKTRELLMEIYYQQKFRKQQ